MAIIPHSSNVQDLGITMSSDCTFNVHINSLSKCCKNLTGWILRTFISRDKLTMLTLFKALVLSRLDYGSQLWSPHKICQINQIEKIQRAFTKHITGMYDLPYNKRLKMLNLNSLHKRRERYCIIYLWKILEGLVPNFSDPIVLLEPVGVPTAHWFVLGGSILVDYCWSILRVSAGMLSEWHLIWR